MFRARYADAVPADRRRRRTAIAGTVAAVTGAALTVVDLLPRTQLVAPPAAVIGIVALAAAAGLLAAAFCPLAPRSTDWSFRATGDWRREERVRRQFAPRPPEMVPEDRSAVLAAVESSRDALVRSAARTVLLPAVWICVLVAALVLGFAREPVVLAGPLFALLQSSSMIAAVTTLGRMELARGRAEALPDLPEAEPPRRPTGRGPTGSKLGLPE